VVRQTIAVPQHSPLASLVPLALCGGGVRGPGTFIFRLVPQNSYAAIGDVRRKGSSGSAVNSDRAETETEPNAVWSAAVPDIKVGADVLRAVVERAAF
jgi:hypothetical protein